MSRFSIVKVFEVFLTFFLKILPLAFPLFKDFIVLPVHDVGVSLFLLFEVAVLSRVLLFFSAKVVV
jgi:hypothetical protein